MDYDVGSWSGLPLGLRAAWFSDRGSFERRVIIDIWQNFSLEFFFLLINLLRINSIDSLPVNFP